MRFTFALPRVSRSTRALILAATTMGAVSLPAAAAQFQMLDKPLHAEPISTELLVQAPDGIQPGRSFWLGLQLKHHGDWHTYWKNPGDSGLPTRLQWSLPSGLSAGEIVWPLPKKFPLGTLTNYGYDGDILLLVPVQVADDLVIPPQFQRAEK